MSRSAAGASTAERIASLPPAARAETIAALSDEMLAGLEYHWPVWARPAQLPPRGAWRVWLILAGRGFGKTRAGAEWVRARAEADGRLRIALVGATMAEARGVMIEGESGLLAIAPPALRPIWEPSLRRLRWPGGAQAFLYSAAEPESLRGPQHHIAWADEIAKWPLAVEAWDNLMMGMRLGERPRTVATTTPRPVPLVRALIGTEAARPRGVVITRGRTADNRAALPASFITAMEESYGGTRLGRQELDGEMIEDVAGALWTRSLIERCRVAAAPLLRRVVVAVDPPASAHGDACGIVVAAIGEDGHAYVIEDASVGGLAPEGCPVTEQHYLAGFVLRSEDAGQWATIEAAADASRRRGAAETFVWALPQVMRDGFVHFDIGGGDGDVQAYDDVAFPIAIGREASVEPTFSTAIVTTGSGHEQRNSDWADARLRFDAGPGVRSEADVQSLIAFFRARRGAARAFRFRDPFDNRSAAGEPGFSDQVIGVGDGTTTRFPLVKLYGESSDAQRRRITRPVAGSVRIGIGGVERNAGWSLDTAGVIAFDAAPATGATVTAGYRFDVPVRFAEDRLEVNRATFGAGSAPSVPLIEVREEFA